MIPDIKTLILTHIIIDIICTLIILSVWYQNRNRFAGLNYLVFSFLFLALGLMLVVLRGVIPDCMSIVFANILIVCGIFLGYRGLELFVDKAGPQAHNYLLLLSYAIAQTYFTFVNPDLATRFLLYSLASLILSLQCFWLMIYRVPSNMHKFTMGVGLVFGAYCVVYGVRIIRYFVSPNTEVNLFQSGAFQAIILISYQMLFIILTYNIVLMINKRLHLDIQLQQQKFAKSFASSPYAISLSRMSDGEIIEVNQGYEKITGYRSDEVIGRPIRDLNLWVREDEEAAAAAALSRSERVYAMEVQFRHKTGEIMYGVLYSEIITINKENFVLTSLNNITRSKKVEEALQNMNMELSRRVEEETERRLVHERIVAEHSRLAEMGNMIGAIAHQWRQPLSTLGMIVQRTHAAGSRKGLIQEQLDEFKTNAMRQIKYMSDTIDEFRNFYRQEKQKAPFAPYACLMDAVKLLEPQLSHRNITMEIICPEEAHRSINAYQNEFKQVILNLFGNARDAILDCRATRGGPETGHILVRMSIFHGKVMIIDVCDNGIGIAKDTAGQIFNPYFTTKQESGGSGIGLYISRMIVEESLKGRISLVQSEAATTFRIELPLEDEE